MFNPRSFVFVLLTGCAVLASSCTRPYPFKDSYITTYQEGLLVKAEKIASKAFPNSLNQEDYKKNKDAVWMLLDRATIRFAQGNSAAAIADYKLAIEAIDYFNQYSSRDTAKQFLLQDDAAAYAGPYYEQILARIYFALALMDSGDISNAHALLRQAESFQQKLNGSSYSPNPLAKYLLAVFSEQANDKSNAELLYSQTTSLISSPLDLPRSQRGNATLLVLCHNGNAPIKISSTCSASVVSAVMLEEILRASNHKLDPAWSSYTGIPIPILYQAPFSAPIALYAAVDNQTNKLAPVLNIASLAHNELQQQTPLIAARGLARMIMRRAAIGCAQEQNRDLGAILDIGMLIANLNTKADTRSWSTLPASIDLTRFSLSPGKHSVSFSSPDGCFSKQTMEVQLEPNDLCIINVFVLHPGITTIVVPKKFHSTQPLNKEIGL